MGQKVAKDSQSLRSTKSSFGRKTHIFSPFEFEIQRNSDHEITKIKPDSFRALKRYLNKKN